jgi:hypothetical protein
VGRVIGWRSTFVHHKTTVRPRNADRCPHRCPIVAGYGVDDSVSANLLSLLVQLLCPVVRDSALRSWYWLVNRVCGRRGKSRAVIHLLVLIVVEPVFAGFVGLHPTMSRSLGMVSCVLPNRGVATANMTALRTAPQMEPPAPNSLAVRATNTAGRCRRIDSCNLCHHFNVTDPPKWVAGGARTRQR